MESISVATTSGCKFGWSDIMAEARVFPIIHPNGAIMTFANWPMLVSATRTCGGHTKNFLLSSRPNLHGFGTLQNGAKGSFGILGQARVFPAANPNDVKIAHGGPTSWG